MVNKKFLLVFCVVVGFYFTGCNTVSSVGGTVDPHGLFSSANVAGSGAEVVASYGVILGILDSGYETYVAAVKKAESEGKMVASITTQYLGFYTKVTAYAAKL